MKRLNYFLVCICCCVLFITCCNDRASVGSNQQKSLSDSYRTAYPKVIDSLHLQDLYDSTKWYLYLLHSMSRPKLIDDYDGHEIPLAYNFCSLELRFHSVEVNNDTTKLYFFFYVNDSTALVFDNFPGLRPYTNGRMYSKKLAPLTLCTLTMGAMFGNEWCTQALSQKAFDTISIRAVNPLQPDVIEYINVNKHVLHPWFYKEAIRKGVIK